MDKQPNEITVCNLEVVLMPQGELICMGKTVGWFKDFQKYLSIMPRKEPLPEPDLCHALGGEGKGNCGRIATHNCDNCGLLCCDECSRAIGVGGDGENGCTSCC